MSWSYGGPPKTEYIKGTVDNIDTQESKFGKNQTVLSLLDVTQRETNGTERELESRTLFIPEGGRPGTVFYTSAAGCLGLKPKQLLTEDMLVGNTIAIQVEYEGVEIDGQLKEMTLYRVVAIEGAENGAASTITDADVLKMIVGKSVGEVFKMRAEVAHSPYAKVLGSKSSVLKYFDGTEGKAKLTYDDGVFKKSKK